MTQVRSSQLIGEVISTGSPDVRVSQLVGEPLVTGTPRVRVSQLILEPLAAGMPRVRASQLVGETLLRGGPRARPSQLMLEVLCLILETKMLPIYPDLPGLGFNVKWTPTFFTSTDTTAAGADIDLSLAAAPIHVFELVYEFLHDSWRPNFRNGMQMTNEFRALAGFFLNLGGSVGRFVFKWDVDHRVTAQPQFTTDGVSSLFGPLARTFGANGNFQTEAVGVVDTTKPFNLYLNGALQNPSTYQLLTGTPLNQQIKFLNTPVADLAATTDMDYFYYCKFQDSNNTFEKFMDRLHLISKIAIKSCRPGA
jgi:hypothetical protein